MCRRMKEAGTTVLGGAGLAGCCGSRSARVWHPAVSAVKIMGIAMIQLLNVLDPGEGRKAGRQQEGEQSRRVHRGHTDGVDYIGRATTGGEGCAGHARAVPTSAESRP